MKNKEYPKAIPGEERYVEWDNEFEQWGIFGSSSGHCYGGFLNKEVAEKSIEELRKTLK